ncbi:LytTR family DNA-binding domain-containing protein [Variovorax sp. OV329]|uniref:LytTR family DNA-binding domain-containing protein n=1 Tax=Variovorax sp. OV329 TaxID=1882825 RepID=UPI0008E92D19|nr:LytTR family DNA-binding domain-containing protein [Variovorax sp. OV329]SFL94641.1 transcriptional regulator, LytTR family [Variovorax sp. OV329]
MPTPGPNLFERYRPFRRRTEIAFWVVVALLQVGASVVVAAMDASAAGRNVAFWQVLSWELSSQFSLLALIPAVFAFERRFPMDLEHLRRNLPWHLLGSVVFSLVHVAAMVAVRHGVYGLAGERYDFGNWLVRWPYEYLKDVRAYALIVLGIRVYRIFMLRLQGEARMLDAPEEPAAAHGDPSQPAAPAQPPATPVRPERFLVRKLRREFLINAADIDWLQAQGNYVGLHVNGHDYLLRATLTDLLAQLDPALYARVHRSYAVHLDRIREIEPLEGGDARLHMRDGTHVPCSRRYRAGLQSGVVAAS